jgi:DNA repair exonuclease SbcCD ATPase subunit
MKKIISLILVFTLFVSILVIADNEDNGNTNDRGNVNDAPNSQESETNNDLLLRERVMERVNETVRERVNNAKEIRERLKERKEQLNEQIQELKEKRRELSQKRNEVRAAVHALLLIKDIDTKVGPRISEIAMEFNNSEDKLQRAEEKIQERSRFMKFLFGVNKQSIRDIEETTVRKQERIEELKQLRDEVEEEETKQVLTEQIEKIEQDQERLRTLTQEEKSKGIFSFLTRG